MKSAIFLAVSLVSIASISANASTLKDYVGSYKVTSVTCGDTNGLQKTCSQNNKETLNIVMIEQTPCVQFGENGGWGMQYCMNFAPGVSTTEPKFDSTDSHGTMRYNMEVKSDGTGLSFLWRVYDNPTYPKNQLSKKMMDGTAVYHLQKI